LDMLRTKLHDVTASQGRIKQQRQRESLPCPDWMPRLVLRDFGLGPGVKPASLWCLDELDVAGRIDGDQLSLYAELHQPAQCLEPVARGVRGLRAENRGDMDPLQFRYALVGMFHSEPFQDRSAHFLRSRCQLIQEGAVLIVSGDRGADRPCPVAISANSPRLF